MGPDKERPAENTVVLSRDLTPYGLISARQNRVCPCQAMVEKIEKNGIVCAVVRGDGIVIADSQSALDLLMTAKYEVGTKNIVIDKRLVNEDFFILSSGLAGEILQKYINYGGRIAVYGDYSRYTSKPLHDFIYESNQGHDIFFAATEDEAVENLCR